MQPASELELQQQEARARVQEVLRQRLSTAVNAVLTRIPLPGDPLVQIALELRRIDAAMLAAQKSGIIDLVPQCALGVGGLMCQPTSLGASSGVQKLSTELAQGDGESSEGVRVVTLAIDCDAVLWVPEESDLRSIPDLFFHFRSAFLGAARPGSGEDVTRRFAHFVGGEDDYHETGYRKGQRHTKQTPNTVIEIFQLPVPELGPGGRVVLVAFRSPCGVNETNAHAEAAATFAGSLRPSPEEAKARLSAVLSALPPAPSPPLALVWLSPSALGSCLAVQSRVLSVHRIVSFFSRK